MLVSVTCITVGNKLKLLLNRNDVDFNIHINNYGIKQTEHLNKNTNYSRIGESGDERHIYRFIK